MASLEDKVEKVKKVSKAEQKAAMPEVAEELQRIGPNKDHFDDLMKQTKSEKVSLDKVDPSRRGSSLIDEVQASGSKIDKPTVVTPTELIAQTEQAVTKMEGLKAKLQQPGTELRSSTVPLLQNKLTHIDENIKVALNKAGVEHKAAAPIEPSNNPIMRFMGFLTDGQYQLNTLASQVEKWHLNGKEISPATMLSLQIKVGYISQELEFFSSLLNKTLESTKTIMNVQV